MRLRVKPRYRKSRNETNPFTGETETERASFKGRSSMSADGRERCVMVQKYLRFHTITRRAV